MNDTENLIKVILKINEIEQLIDNTDISDMTIIHHIDRLHNSVVKEITRLGGIEELSAAIDKL